jgi:hypothetical protein
MPPYIKIRTRKIGGHLSPEDGFSLYSRNAEAFPPNYMGHIPEGLDLDQLMRIGFCWSLVGQPLLCYRASENMTPILRLLTV